MLWAGGDRPGRKTSWFGSQLPMRGRAGLAHVAGRRHTLPMVGSGTVVEQVEGDGLVEFCNFADVVYAERSAHWPALPDLQLPLLRGESPDGDGRRSVALVADSEGQTVARAVAVVDRRYIDHWDEPLGHIIMFEALPDTTEAVCVLLNEACGWLRDQGMHAARTGMGPGFDLPFVLDSFELLPPISTRQNPRYYPSLLKEARFESEKGWVDYKIEVTPELVDRWKHMVRSAERAGFAILSFAEADADRRVSDFSLVWEEAFANHWGMSPNVEAEWRNLFEFVGPLGAYDISMLAYREDEPIGAILGLPDLSMLATLLGDRQLLPEEHLNMLGIGVRESARGRGVNLAIAARSYLELVKRGHTHVSYTMVLDDNWPSRRTAEKLGARVCANYLTYRRELDPTSR